MSTSFRTVRPDQNEYAPYYGKYVGLVPDGDIIITLSKSHTDSLAILSDLTEQQAASRYAPGKWSIKEVVGHMIDAERVFAYRALRFGRNDHTPLPGFEQDDYVRIGGFDSRSLSGLVSEFDHVRRATLDLLDGFDEEAWNRRGVASNFEISVRALAWVMAGHERHHMQLIRTRYLP